MASVESQALDQASAQASPINMGNSSNTSFDDFLKKVGQKEEANQDEIKGKIADVEKDIKSQQPPGPPVLQEVPKDVQNVSPLEAFGSPAMWIAVLGSAFTKQPFMNTLAATTGVLKAAQANNAESFNKQMDLLKIHNDNAIKTANYEMETYKNALDKDKSLLGAYTSMFKNDTAATMANAKMANDYLNMYSKQLDAYRKNFPLERWQDHMDVWKQGHPNASPAEIDEEGMRVFKDLTKKGGGSGPISDADYEKLKTSPEVIQGAKSMHMGMLLSQIRPGFSSSDPTRQAISRLYAEQYPGENYASQHLKYVGNTTQARALESQTVKVQLASHILDTSIPSLIDEAKKLGFGPSTDLNKIAASLREHINDPTYSNFRTQLRAVSTDYAQFIGRGRQTVHSDEEALKILNATQNVNSLQGFQSAVTTERNNVQKGIRDTEKSVFGPDNEIYRDPSEPDIQESTPSTESGGINLPAPPPPSAGEIMDGYKFKGGDPGDRKNWEKAQ